MGISFISASVLSLEISLTRYLSISQNYHFAFLVVSLAFLGYGASGTFLTLFRVRIESMGERWLSLSSFLFALSIPASFLATNSLPFDLLELPWNRKQILYLLPYCLVLGLPFFFAGATVSSALTRLAREAHRVYFADLVGAGFGSLLALGLFFPRGEKGVFLTISALALIGCLLLSSKRAPLFLALIAALLLLEGTMLFRPPESFRFRVSPFKALPLAMKYPGAQLLLTRVDSSARVDVFRSPAARFAPGLSLLYGQPLPPQLGLSIDGGELSAVTGINSLQDENLAFLSFLPSSLPYYLVSRPRVLILEPRGGLDVLAALYFQASSVKGVESHPAILHLLQHELASFNGHLYNRPIVSMVTAHPREALKKEKASYDLIVFGLPDVFGSTGTGLYGIRENYLYTVESFLDVLDHLTPEGMVSQTMYLLPPPRQEPKMVATWVQALEKSDLEPASHIAAIRTWGTLSLFIKKKPFLPRDIDGLKEFCRNRLFDVVYFPGIQVEETNLHNQMAQPVYEDLLRRLLTAGQRKSLLADYLFEIRPASDNRPFFYDFYKWGKWRMTYEALGRNPALFFEGKFLLVLLLGQAGLVAFILIVLPLFRLRHPTGPLSTALAVFFYFGLLGAAFISIQILFIQKFILFLGHPLYSISTVIFALLLSSGLGSLASRKMLSRFPIRRLQRCLLLLAVVVFIYRLGLSPFFEKFIGLNLPGKVILTLSLIFPLGFLMGFPFPTGIRLLQERNPKLIPWAWSVNAFSTVIHSVMAHLLALQFGIAAILALAACAYLAGIPLLCFANHGDKTNA